MFIVEVALHMSAMQTKKHVNRNTRLYDPCCELSTGTNQSNDHGISKWNLYKSSNSTTFTNTLMWVRYPPRWSAPT